MPDRISQLLDFLKDDPEDPFLLFALAREYEQLGKEDDMFRIFTKLVTLEYPGVYYHFGKALERKGDLDQAMRIYSEGIRIARLKGDLHAASELQQAKSELENGF